MHYCRMRCFNHFPADDEAEAILFFGQLTLGAYDQFGVIERWIGYSYYSFHAYDTLNRALAASTRQTIVLP